MKTSEIVKRVNDHGFNSVNDEQLLELLIGDGAKGVLEELPMNKIYYLGEATVEEIQKAYNVGKTRATRLLGAVELGKRISRQHAKETAPDFSTPNAIANYVMEDLRFLPQEQFGAVYLSSKNQLIAYRALTVGTINASLAKPREVFRYALHYNAASVVLIHNHPSGNPEPSNEDIMVTRKIVEAGEKMEIPVLDHIIIGDGTYVSLCERGYL